MKKPRVPRGRSDYSDHCLPGTGRHAARAGALASSTSADALACVRARRLSRLSGVSRSPSACVPPPRQTVALVLRFFFFFFFYVFFFCSIWFSPLSDDGAAGVSVVYSTRLVSFAACAACNNIRSVRLLYNRLYYSLRILRERQHPRRTVVVMIAARALWLRWSAAPWGRVDRLLVQTPYKGKVLRNRVKTVNFVVSTLNRL